MKTMDGKSMWFSLLILFCLSISVKPGSTPSVHYDAFPEYLPPLDNRHFSEPDTSPPSKERFKVLWFRDVQSFRDAIENKRLTMVYFKPVAPMTNRQRKEERTYEKEIAIAAEYLHHGYEVVAATMHCRDVTDAELKAKACPPKLEENVVRFYSSGRELVELGVAGLYDENSLVSNVLTVLLVNDIHIIEKPNEILKLEKKYVGKKNIVVSYHDIIGSAPHREIMEVAHHSKREHLFVITTFNESLSLLPLGTDLTRLPTTAVWVLLCKESTGVPCHVVNFTETGSRITSKRLGQFLYHLELEPVKEFPDPDLPPASMEPVTMRRSFPETELHEITISFDSRPQDGLKKRDFLRNVAKELSLRYRGEIGFVLFDRAFESPPSDVVGSVLIITFRAFSKESQVKEDLPSTKLLYTDDAFALEGDLIFMLWDRIDDELRRAHKNDDDDDDDDELFKEKLDDPVLVKLQEYMGNKSWEEHVHRHVATPKSHGLKEFRGMIESRSKSQLVLFYLFTDGNSKLALLAFGKSAKISDLKPKTKNSFLRIHCGDWPDVCLHYGVVRYPVVKIFDFSADGVSHRDFSGIVDVDSLVVAANLLSEPPVLTAKEADGLRGNGYVQRASFLHATGRRLDEMGTAMFKEVARKHRGEAIFVIDDEGVSDRRQCPDIASEGNLIVVRRPWDNLWPEVCVELKATGEDLWPWISAAARRSAWLEITVKTLPQVLEKDRPLLVLFVNEIQEPVEDSTKGLAWKLAGILVSDGEREESDHRQMLDWAHSEFSSAVSVGWMNVAANPLHKEVFKTYHPLGTDQTIPSLTFVDFQKGKAVNIPFSTALNGVEWLRRLVENPDSVDDALLKPIFDPASEGPGPIVLSRVVHLPRGYVGPAKKNIDFKQKLAMEAKMKKEKKRRREKAGFDDDDEGEVELDTDEEDSQEETRGPSDFRGTKITGNKMEEKTEVNRLEAENDLAERIKLIEHQWKKDPTLLLKMKKEIDSEASRKSFRKVLKELMRRNPDRVVELEELIHKPIHNEL